MSRNEYVFGSQRNGMPYLWIVTSNRRIARKVAKRRNVSHVRCYENGRSFSMRVADRRGRTPNRNAAQRRRIVRAYTARNRKIKAWMGL